MEIDLKSLSSYLSWKDTQDLIFIQSERNKCVEAKANDVILPTDDSELK